ncbi:MAG: hypothetical protein C4576_19735 [Desulfobacteraceae bacterium]|nr:MAG: hypothetical protein C4576_19735 [Desulfobacteraceae bacterium]
MRIVGWRAKEVAREITDQAIANANGVMDDVVEAAKRRCPVSPIVREGKWVNAIVSFTPKTGKGKGKPVQFSGKRWTGRTPGDLRKTIRRVNKRNRPGNIRVYAGSTKIYWGGMVEYGTSKTAAQPFMRPAFNGIKNQILKRIKNGG